ncbi:hypothetical protein VTL71DRAFT_10393 [Oculimacula yallundae]|uniref:Heterokaryon incompatibility domain-containing protein n=1 Tax=Oculimacula yallundae TaxID=86028 RepID=A0ABR4CVG6_9HELO
MRLINTKTLQIESFPCFNRPEIPPYAILSHRWGADEVSLQEMQLPSASLTSKLGYLKMLKCCELAASFGFEHVWIDTCCIDKSSSSELTETINSMFNYYRDAEVCYAYMVDVPSNEDPAAIGSKFRSSSWFTRGWTLQELLAPKSVVFYGNDWTEIGMISSLEELIGEITLIAPRALENYEKYRHKFSIAQKMAWASSRETERLEDAAYCLLGLFGVNMPLIYGEGRNAFRRLQLELLKESDDQTIFAWRAQRPESVAGFGQRRGLLAYSPVAFSGAHNVVRRLSNDHNVQSKYSMTNVGLEIRLPLINSEQYHEENLSVGGVFLAVLQCSSVGDSYIGKFWPTFKDDNFLGIYLHLLNDGLYERVYTNTVEYIGRKLVAESAVERKIYVTQTLISPLRQLAYSQHIHVLQRRVRPSRDPSTATLKDHALVNWMLAGEEVKFKVGAGMTTSNNGIALLFTYDTAQSACGIFVGMGHQGFYYNIVPDMASEHFDSLAAGLWKKGAVDIKAHCDRILIALKGEQILHFAVRPGFVDGMRARLVEVSVEGEFCLNQIVDGLGILQ